MRGYKDALEAAGFEVKWFEEFGSYQGDWFAVSNDKRVIQGSYGSCSGCDAFMAEFDFKDEPTDAQLKEFGESYLPGIETLEEAIARYERKSTDSWFPVEDQEILKWLKSLKNEN